MALYRTCPHCGTEYKASRPACPACGKPPVSRQSAFHTAGPTILALVVFLAFFVLLLYGLFLPDEIYETYRLYLFGLPRLAAILVGAAGAVATAVVSLVLRRGANTTGR